jgi:tRNA1Val (adenine37-N6)-methyltransferase
MSRPPASDNPGRHGLNIRQPERGYRFSLDALLLADFARLPEGAAVADLGTGCGIIPLVLARSRADVRCVAVENNPDMAALALENARENRLEERIEVICDDILNTRSRFPDSTFDVVLANPPFRTPHSGRISPHAGRDAARHETSAGLADFLAAAKYLVKPSGRICIVFLPSRLAELMVCARDQKLALLRLRMVHGTDKSAAKIFLVELAKGRRGELVIEPPLFVRDASGGYTAEAATIVG